MITRPRAVRRRPTRGKTFLRLLQYLFLEIGILALGYYGYVQAEAYFYQAYQNWRLDQMQQGKPASVERYVKQWIPFLPSEEPTTSAQNNPVELPQPAESAPVASPKMSGEAGGPDVSVTAPRALAPEASLLPTPARRAHRMTEARGSLIGRIEIPRIHLRAIVMEGIDSRTLRLAVGHMPGTALPGEPGNVDIAAHRDTFFNGLQNIRHNDLISLSTLSGRVYHYRVGSIAVVGPHNVAILQKPGGPGLNLITCYPFNYLGPAPKRFVVHADEISEPGSQSAEQSPEQSSDLDSSSDVQSAAEIRPVVHTESPAKISRRPSTPTNHRKSARRVKPRTNKAPLLAKDSVAPYSPSPNFHNNRNNQNKVRTFFRKMFHRDNA